MAEPKDTTTKRRGNAKDEAELRRELRRRKGAKVTKPERERSKVSK